MHPDRAIVPLPFGFTSARAIAAVVAEVWSDETLLVVSSDLSHYEDYETARIHDLRTAESIEAFEESVIGPADACGHLAARGALIEAKAPRANNRTDWLTQFWRHRRR